MMVQYRAVLVLSAAILVLATGCSSKSGSTSSSSAPTTSGPVAASPTTANLAGTWQGYVGVGARSTTVSLNLRQEGQALKGNLEVGGRPDISGSVTGRVSGDTLTLQPEFGSESPLLRVKGDTMTGLIGAEPLSVRRVK